MLATSKYYYIFNISVKCVNMHFDFPTESVIKMCKASVIEHLDLLWAVLILEQVILSIPEAVCFWTGCFSCRTGRSDHSWFWLQQGLGFHQTTTRARSRLRKFQIQTSSRKLRTACLKFQLPALATEEFSQSLLPNTSKLHLNLLVGLPVWTS